MLFTFPCVHSYFSPASKWRTISDIVIYGPISYSSYIIQKIFYKYFERFFTKQKKFLGFYYKIDKLHLYF